MAPWRLAVVVLVPPPVSAEIDVLRRALGVDDVDRVPPHVTLVPPVNVRSADFGAALAVLRSAVANRDPFDLRLGPVSSFDPVTPTIHLVVDDPEQGLSPLRSAVFRPPLWRRVDHAFVPHVTLAEQAPLHLIGAARLALAGYGAVLPVDRVTMLSERRNADGQRIWRPLADMDLDGVRIVGQGGLPIELVSGSLLDPLTVAELGLTELGLEHPPVETQPVVDSQAVVVARREDRAVGAVWAEESGGCVAEDDGVADLLMAEWHFRQQQRAERAQQQRAERARRESAVIA